MKKNQNLKIRILVLFDESGKVVRTIGNKEARPEKLTFITFFKQLFKPKQGVLIPDSLIWNGVSDAGETVPDGTYFYYATAADDNGNVNKTSLYTVIVDNSEPVIELTRPPFASWRFSAHVWGSVCAKSSMRPNDTDPAKGSSSLFSADSL